MGDNRVGTATVGLAIQHEVRPIMAATVIKFPAPLKKEKPYVEPYEAEYLALIATDHPVGYRGGRPSN